ncbi:MAG: hypothetical protein QME79_10285 [Bacillota bacterium]|nr:hypothetical protein [Bacillota bacterium]
MTRLRWTREAVLAAIRRRHADGWPINYAAVVADDEKLTGAARRLFGSWSATLNLGGSPASHNDPQYLLQMVQRPLPPRRKAPHRFLPPLCRRWL